MTTPTNAGSGVATTLRALAPYLCVLLCLYVGVVSAARGELMGPIMTINYLLLFRGFLRQDADMNEANRLVERAIALLDRRYPSIAETQP